MAPAPRHEPLFPAGIPAARNAIVHPTRIDATAGPGDFVDITFDWMPGVPSTLRIPKAVAIALGSDLLGLGASSTVVPGPRSGTRNLLFPWHSPTPDTPTPPIGGIPVHAAHEVPQDDDSVSFLRSQPGNSPVGVRAPAVAPPATGARFPRPGGTPPPAVSPPSTAQLPPGRVFITDAPWRGRRRFFTTPNLFAWGLIAALLVAAFVLWATGAGHVGD